jgi:hypothetical protein
VRPIVLYVRPIGLFVRPIGLSGHPSAYLGETKIQLTQLSVAGIWSELGNTTPILRAILRVTDAMQCNTDSSLQEIRAVILKDLGIKDRVF